MAIAATIVLAGLLFTLRLQVNTDISALMPEHSRISSAFLKALEDFGTTDRLILAIESRQQYKDGSVSDRQTLKDSGRQIAEAMAKTGLFTSVDYRVTAQQRAFFEDLYFDHPFHYQTRSELATVEGKLQSDEIQQQVARLGKSLRLSPFGSSAQEQLLRDPLGFRDETDSVSGQGHLSGFRLDLSDGYFFSTDGSLLLITAKPRMPSQDTSFDVVLLEQLEQLLLEMGGTGGFSSDYSMTLDKQRVVRLLGPYVEVLYGSKAAQKEILPSIIVTCLGLLLLFTAVYRNVKTLLILIIPLLAGIIVTSGLVSIFSGHLTMITVGFAAILIGLGIDFEIHLVERIGQESKKGTAIRESIATAFGTTGRGVLAGALTSSAIFLLITMSDFGALQEFGWIIGIGILICLVSMFTLLPALLVSFPVEIHSRLTDLRSDWASWIVSHNRLVIVMGILLTLALGYSASLLELESNVYKLGPMNQPYEQQKERILQAVGGSTNVVLVVIESEGLQSLLELSEQVASSLGELKVNGAIDSFESLSSILPSSQTQRATIQLVQGWDLPESMQTFRHALITTGFKTAPFEAFIGNVLEYLSDRGNSIQLDELRDTAGADMVDRFLVQQDGLWRSVTYIYPRQGQWENEIPLAVVESIEGLGEGVTLTGVVPSFNEIATSTRDEFLKLTLSALAVVLLISMLFFRKATLTFMSVVPAVVGLIWTLGLMKIAGFELNLITIMVAPMIVGLGVDDALHVLNRHRENTAALPTTMQAVSGAILMTSATTVIGFGSLAFADLSSLRSLGSTASIGMLCCAVTSLVLLPALLTFFGGRK